MSVQPRLSPADVAALPQGTVLLDVRTPIEFETAHIPGSVNVPLSLIESNAAAIGSELNSSTVLICRAGPRAVQAQKLLAGAGFLDAGVLDGGVDGWRAAGQPLEQGKARWDLERQVRLVAGSIVATGVVASKVLPKAKWLSAGIGGGLVFAAVSNTCTMSSLLAKLPYNKTAEVTLDDAQRSLRSQPTV
jgi:rhodanese-related sulfurtransferase